MNKDLDFDELDRAVNSLMGGVKEKDDDTTVKAKTLDISETLAPDETPSYKNLDDAAGDIGSETIDSVEKTVDLDASEDESGKPNKDEDLVGDHDDNKKDSDAEVPPTPVVSAAPSPAPAKSSGRFMDVVHPSSDMRNKPMQVSRVGRTIETTPNTEEKVSDTIEEPEAAANTAPEPTTAGNLPVSSEGSNTTPDDNPSSSEEKQKGADEPENDKPYSPFVPDVKVEKRPLGGEPTASDEEQDTPSDIQKTDNTNEDTTEKTERSEEKQPDDVTDAKKDDEYSRIDAFADPLQPQTEITEHIPEEFNNDLIEVEKSYTEPIATEVQPHEELADTHKSPDQDYKGDEETTTKKIPEIASIPKQYSEKPNTGDNSTGTIYDTKNYHKPLDHPPKQKSGWLWVLFVIVFILAGGALGAAAFFFGLI